MQNEATSNQCKYRQNIKNSNNASKTPNKQLNYQCNTTIKIQTIWTTTATTKKKHQGYVIQYENLIGQTQTIKFPVKQSFDFSKPLIWSYKTNNYSKKQTIQKKWSKIKMMQVQTEHQNSNKPSKTPNVQV